MIGMVLLKFCLFALMSSLVAGQHLIESTTTTQDTNSTTQQDTSLRIASRRKRYLIFPKGSSFQLVYCFLTTAYGTPGGLFTIGITLGLAWEIPQDIRPFLQNITKDLTQLHRRHRRDLYPKIESFLDKKGVDGRSCVLRSICEAHHRKKENTSFIEELMHTIFNFPRRLQDDYWDEQEDDSVYDGAHHSDDCSDFERDCPIPILDLDFT